MGSYEIRNQLKDALLLYAVTDRAWLNGCTLEEQVAEAINGGITCLQLREKHLNESALLQEAERIGALCKKRHIPFIVNDNVDVAVACHADGVHVGQHDMEAGNVRERIGKNMLLGVSVQTVEQARLAEQCGADYLGVGAMFHTDTKTDADDVDLATLSAICRSVSIPVVAIGGITADNAAMLASSGVAGIAVVSAIFAKPCIQEATRQLLDICRKNFTKQSFMKTSLTIAGSDCSGGAGIQADIKTMTVNGVYAMSAITALTAQNTTGVSQIIDMPPDFLARQLDAIFTDIRPDSVKVGMVSSKMLIDVIAGKLQEYQATNIVVDPVMVATSGARLLADDAIASIKSRLLPLATLITPNIPEAEVLSGMKITTADDMISAAQMLGNTYHCNVLCKGGHNLNDANDLFWNCSTGEYTWFYGQRINTSNTHGTGCTLSSAIAANLAKGKSLHDAISAAKTYISKALEYGLNLGKGNGPMNHAWMIQE